MNLEFSFRARPRDWTYCIMVRYISNRITRLQSGTSRPSSATDVAKRQLNSSCRNFDSVRTCCRNVDLASFMPLLAPTRYVDRRCIVLILGKSAASRRAESRCSMNTIDFALVSRSYCLLRKLSSSYTFELTVDLCKNVSRQTLREQCPVWRDQEIIDAILTLI